MRDAYGCPNFDRYIESIGADGPASFHARDEPESDPADVVEPEPARLAAGTDEPSPF